MTKNKPRTSQTHCDQARDGLQDPQKVSPESTVPNHEPAHRDIILSPTDWDGLELVPANTNNDARAWAKALNAFVTYGTKKI